MSVRAVRLLALPLSATIGVLGLTGVPSQGATPSHDSHAAVSKKKHPKHHHGRIKNRKLGVPKPSPLSGPSAGQASLSWPKTKGANRYSVLWSSAPYGKWPGPTTYVGRKWLPGATRSATLDVSGLGGYQLSPAYGNPAFMSLWADNSRDRAPRHKAKYVAVWPKIAAPAEGAHLRIGQYNIERGGRSLDGLAANITQQGLDLVALQETDNSVANGAGSAVASKAGMVYLATSGQEGIAFNRSRVSCSNPTYVGPHALAATCSVGQRTFTFVSAHFTGSNADTGAQAQATASNLGGGTTIIAGDFTSNREPYGSANQAQPVLVRNGFWDAQSSLDRSGVQYSTYNGHATQPVNASGVGTRSDYIMSRGIAGSFAYRNVVGGAGNPSDHNLVWAELAIP